MAAMWRSLHCRVRDHYFFCFWLFFFVFFTITNTKDPVKKTFCFTGNKNIIYASVKCKNLLPPDSSSQTRPLWSSQPTEHTGDFCVLIHHCGERNERTVPTDRTELLCTTFQVLMNKRWNWQPCLSLLFCPLLPLPLSAQDNTDNFLLLLLVWWCWS